MTEKLYWADPFATSFETTGASLVGIEGGDRAAVVLDRTLFYPEGGGQLGDVGTLTVFGRALVVSDTQIDDAGIIRHVLAESLTSLADIAEQLRAEGASAAVRGDVDAVRRRDHMAQHTGQHALSRALADEARAETVSSRLGASTCTIDVARPGIPDAELHRTEDLVNAIVMSDVPVRSRFPSPEELAAMPLRKKPSVTEGIRVIDIEGFDVTPCGGTHCTRSGQIGPVFIAGVEKYKGMLRITFHAGRRAIADARATGAIVATLASDLTCGAADVPSAVTKLRADLKASRTQLEAAREELAELVAAGMLAEHAARIADGLGAVVLVASRPKEDVAFLRLVAGKLAREPRVVAVCAGDDTSTGELIVVLQRGTQGQLDCGSFLAAQTKALHGRGGGRPERAEGRFPRGTAIDAIAEAAERAILRP